MLRTIAAFLVLLSAQGADGSVASELSLKPVSRGGEPSPQVIQSSSDLVDVSLFERQTFDLWLGARRLGVLATGAGREKDSQGAPVCFVALVREGVADVVKTIGTGDWEAETCIDAAAVGPVKGVGSYLRVAVIFKATSPNADALEPIVLRFPEAAAKPMSLDGAATKAASLAGAVTLGEVAKAVSR